MAGEDAFGNNAEFTADLTVDDVEAEGFDNEMDPYDALTERTVTLAITDGLSFACLGSPEGVYLPDVSKAMAQAPQLQRHLAAQRVRRHLAGDQEKSRTGPPSKINRPTGTSNSR